MTYNTYRNGNITGITTVSFLTGQKVADVYKDKIQALITGAKLDNVVVTIGSGFRTQDEQITERIKNVKDKSRKTDMNYIMSEPSSSFYPVTARPGYSNHQSGQAVDFNVTGFPEVYKWLVRNAIKFGFIRTVLSERWHWEYLPNIKDQFAVVPKTDLTWDHLV